MDWQRYHQLEALSRSGNSQAALSGFQKLLTTSETPEEKAVTILAIADCLRNLGRRVEARETVSQAFPLLDQSSETLAWALLFSARMEIDDGRWKEALEKLNHLMSNFETLLRLPENQDGLQNVQRERGIALYELDRPKEALPLLEGAAVRDVERAKVLYYLGRCCYDLGSLEKAKEYLQEALKLDLHPVYQPSAHYVLGLAYQWKGQHAWAIREFEWCLEHDIEGRVAKWKVLTALANASKAVGQERDAERYSKMLRGLPRRSDARARN